MPLSFYELKSGHILAKMIHIYDLELARKVEAILQPHWKSKVDLNIHFDTLSSLWVWTKSVDLDCGPYCMAFSEETGC